ncbi:MAG TPA: CYCXC family (seleno)protein [Candidatus Binataceae bacterium]|jgi:hypothetical protein|nr:CYCXC family (seleno)protein [Candidatus Binataceae bacterium]
MPAGAAVLVLLTLTVVMAYRLRSGAAAPAAGIGDRLTLDPSRFEGDTRLAYEAAQKHPELLAQLHCYCGCEEDEGCKNLLDCFRTNHGAECATCMGEAITAMQMYEGGSPVDQIADAMRKQYGNGG